METWFKTGSYGELIEPVQVSRSTTKTVQLVGSGYYDGRRANKQSSYENYFQTFDDAVIFLRDQLTDRLDSKKRQVDHANDALNKFEQWIGEQD